MRDHPCRLLPLLVGLTLVAVFPPPALAWTAETVVRMTDHALRVSPPHLVGQIERHDKQLNGGIRAAARSDPRIAADGSRNGVQLSLGPVIETEIDRAIERIVEHQPFSNIVFQLGVVSYWVAAINNPLQAADPTPDRPRYWQDYFAYLEEVNQRFAVLYYPHERRIGSRPELVSLLDSATSRTAIFAPAIATEYVRIGGGSGLDHFDDKSTAFGVGSVAFSHAVSDIAGVLRYIWLQAGGADTFDLPVLDRDHLILISSGSQRN